jgi:hypothetical protein
MHGAMNGIQEGIIAHIDLAVPEWYVYTTRLATAIVVALIFSSILSKNKFLN